MIILPCPLDWVVGHKFVFDPEGKHPAIAALPYRVVLGPGALVKSDGAPFVAYAPAFGNHSLRAYGDTPQEALDDLESMVPSVLEWWKGQYGSLPKPDTRVGGDDDWLGL
jgi:hypothetical protein